MTDLVGKTIVQKTNLVSEEFVLDLTDRPNNIYLLVIEEPGTGKTTIHKLIKQ